MGPALYRKEKVALQVALVARDGPGQLRKQ